MLSKSKIGCYKQCPYLYKLIYIDKVQPEFEYETSYAKRGKDIHDLLYLFFDNYTVENGVVVPTFSIPYPYRKFFSHFLTFEQMRYEMLKEKYPAILYRETDFVNEELGIHGIIDRMDELPTITIIEYKTGDIDPVELVKELHFYYLCVKPQIEAEKVLGLCLKNGTVVTSPIRQNILEVVLKDIEFVRKGIEEGRFDKKPSYNCRWCPFYELCQKD